jgi:RNA polymerase sigma factor (sigma-70 family)
MILTDASVVIVYERVHTPRLKKIITDEEASACGVTVAELYAGVRSAKDEAKLRRELLGHWLYRIAFQTALKARAMNLRRRAREGQARLRPHPEPPDGDSEELLARLDAEISRLPEKYRVAVVLCELEGKSRKDVASLLGLPEGTLSSRLANARKLLARRLKTSAALSGSLLTAALGKDAAAAVPAALLKSTARAGAVPAQVLTLTDGVIKAMFLSKLASRQGSQNRSFVSALGGGITRPSTLVSYLVTKLHHAVLVGPNFG